ncbi:MAG: type II toxin-antitoxin system RelE/ParE family toxin [Candidatus Zambryskibacteria bacterium]
MKAFYLPKVTKFIESLGNDLTGKIVSLVDVLKEKNGLLSTLDSKSLGRGLFELRLASSVNIRIFFCFHRDTIYLLHGIIKKTQKTPKREIEFARKMKDMIVQL